MKRPRHADPDKETQMTLRQMVKVLSTMNATLQELVEGVHRIAETLESGRGSNDGEILQDPVEGS